MEHRLSSIRKRRPAFTVDYAPRIHAETPYNYQALHSDLREIRAWIDPIVVRALQFAYTDDMVRNGPEDRSETRGTFVIPDLRDCTTDELAAWKESTARRVRELLCEYRESGFEVLNLHILFVNHGIESSPAWCTRAEGWSEPNGAPCLVHPALGVTLARTFRMLNFLNGEPAFAGIHVDNEPSLVLFADPGLIGINEHTSAEFSHMLACSYGDVASLNQIAGTSYGTFDEVRVDDANLIVQSLARRFRSSLVPKYYLGRALEEARSSLPESTLITRIQTGWFLMESFDGREIASSELTYLRSTEADVIAWSVLWDDTVASGMGTFEVTCGILAGGPKQLGLSETFVQRHGFLNYSTLRPDELERLVLRGLWYGLGMVNLHSWNRPGTDADDSVTTHVWDEPFGMQYRTRADALHTIGRLRSELDECRPYETFGAPLGSLAVIVVSRNARAFPGGPGLYYGNLLFRLCSILGSEGFEEWRVVEEETGCIERALTHARGVVVVDACLSKETRRAVSDF